MNITAYTSNFISRRPNPHASILNSDGKEKLSGTPNDKLIAQCLSLTTKSAHLENQIKEAMNAWEEEIKNAQAIVQEIDMEIKNNRHQTGI